MNIVLDTNVYVAAFLSKKLASEILLLGENNKVNLFVSGDILKELKNVLADKFGVDEFRIRAYLEQISRCTNIVVPQRKIDVIKVDPTDNMILECAVEAGANLIITMDKHLLKLKTYEKIGIVHPKTLTWIIPKLLG